MKRFKFFAIAFLCLAIMLPGCSSSLNNTAKGGIIGGTSGAGVGALIGGLIGKGKGAGPVHSRLKGYICTDLYVQRAV